MPTTPVYGIPYQSLADPPDGPSLGEDGFLAVETELARIDATATGHTASIAALQATQVRTAVKTDDEPAIVSNTTLQNDDHLFLTVEANATYAFRLDMLYVTPAAADIKIGWTYPVGLTMTWGGIAYSASEQLVTFAGQTETSTPAFGGGGSELVAYVTGTVFVGANAGTLRLQTAQNTSNGGNTVTRKGSSLVLLKA